MFIIFHICLSVFIISYYHSQLLSVHALVFPNHVCVSVGSEPEHARVCV